MPLTPGTRLGPYEITAPAWWMLALVAALAFAASPLVLPRLLPGLGLVTPAMAGSLELRLFAFPSSATAEWQTVNDGVMGGVSKGRFRITDRQTMAFYGTLSMENNGGFASVRSRPRTLGLQAGDTLYARVRGDGREYQLHLYTPSRRMAFSYRAPIPTRASEWTEVRIPLDRFEATSFGQVMKGTGPVEPGRVSSLGFLLGDGTPGPFLLEVAWVRVLRGLAR